MGSYILSIIPNYAIAFLFLFSSSQAPLFFLYFSKKSSCELTDSPWYFPFIISKFASFHSCNFLLCCTIQSFDGFYQSNLPVPSPNKVKENQVQTFSQHFTIPQAIVHRCFLKQVFLKISQISQKNTCVRVSFQQQLYQKQTPTQVFFSEICEIFKNTFFNRTPPVAASALPQRML